MRLLEDTHLAAGRLVHLITIYQPTSAQSPDGQPVASKTPAVFAQVHAEFLEVAGGERVRGQTMQADTTALFTVHYLAGVKPTMTIAHDGRTFQILSARDPAGRKISLVIQAKDVVR
jgi:SPP1 family predicted phage head-tail adaptor